MKTTNKNIQNDTVNNVGEVFEEGFLEGVEAVGSIFEDVEAKDKTDIVKEKADVIPIMSWVEVEEKFKNEMTSRFMHELSKLKGASFTSKYLQFAEFIMPKKQRIEGRSGLEDLDVTINITKQIDQKTIVVNDILKDHGVEIPNEFLNESKK